MERDEAALVEHGLEHDERADNNVLGEDSVSVESEHVGRRPVEDQGGQGGPIVDASNAGRRGADRRLDEHRELVPTAQLVEVAKHGAPRLCDAQPIEGGPRRDLVLHRSECLERRDNGRHVIEPPGADSPRENGDLFLARKEQVVSVRTHDVDRGVEPGKRITPELRDAVPRAHGPRESGQRDWIGGQHSHAMSEVVQSGGGLSRCEPRSLGEQYVHRRKYTM
ncbi:MAG TPA: hypothetical protein VIK61_09915 [Acidimicrobiia bacterium]